MPSYVRAGIRKCARIRALSEAIDGDVLKPEVTDDLLADVRSIIENERRSIAKAHAKTVNVEIE